MRDYEAVLKQARTCANRKYCDIGGNCEYYDLDVCCQGGEKDILKDAADAIEELLAKRTAFWVDTQPHLDDSSCKKDGMSYYCSNCHHRAGKYKHRTYRFCPWCGAKIVKKGENDDKQYQLHG